jgi:hypothetical protein
MSSKKKKDKRGDELLFLTPEEEMEIDDALRLMGKSKLNEEKDTLKNHIREMVKNCKLFYKDFDHSLDEVDHLLAKRKDV